MPPTMHGRADSQTDPAPIDIVNPDGAVFIDDDRGIAALRSVQEMPHQRGLARAQKTGDEGHRDACAARTLLLPAERPRLGRLK